jgi:2-phosphosulfolactate phosphatase
MSEPAVAPIFGQTGAGVRLEWGPTGAARIADARGCLVVVDVLSFSTAVTVAVARGMALIPYRFDPDRFDRADAREFAASRHAELAVRREDVDAAHPWSLSPAHLAVAPLTPRLVLPSPNGSAIASAAVTTVVAACLRNHAAVTRWLLARGYGTPTRPAAVVAAGERWPDGSLRPALEDALGAGAVMAGLDTAGCGLSPEAAALAAAYRATADVARAVRCCGSAHELVEAGYGADVDMALEFDDETVPVLVDGAFVGSPGD